ncbi:hypothetical protein PAPHI01_1203, partial [Pancytospora philotis]
MREAVGRSGKTPGNASAPPKKRAGLQGGTRDDVSIFDLRPFHYPSGSGEPAPRNTSAFVKSVLKAKGAPPSRERDPSADRMARAAKHLLEDIKISIEGPGSGQPGGE